MFPILHTGNSLLQPEFLRLPEPQPPQLFLGVPLPAGGLDPVAQFAFPVVYPDADQAALRSCGGLPGRFIEHQFHRGNALAALDVVAVPDTNQAIAARFTERPQNSVIAAP